MSRLNIFRAGRNFFVKISFASKLNSGISRPDGKSKFMRSLLVFIIGLVSLNLFARESTLLDSGWKFQLGDITNVERINFDDSDWQSVSIPHCWGWQEAQEGKKNYYRGPGRYRRELDVVPQP